jgi:secreted Zn-dependent insulinase-like peptidase
MMDCINHFHEIMNNMPASETAFNIAKEGLTKQLASARTLKSDIIYRWYAMKELGLDFDLNKKIYEDLKKVTLQDMVNFEKANMANKNCRYLILGDEKELDMESLGKIGPIRRLTTEEVFGY